jgi:membrane protein
LPFGILQLVADQILVVAKQGNDTLGTAFIVGLVIALASANSGIAALFDALNVVYNEREKRASSASTQHVPVHIGGDRFRQHGDHRRDSAPAGVKFLGLANQTEWLVRLFRWPILLLTVGVSLAFIYRLARVEEMLDGAG